MINPRYCLLGSVMMDGVVFMIGYREEYVVTVRDNSSGFAGDHDGQ